MCEVSENKQPSANNNSYGDAVKILHYMEERKNFIYTVRSNFLHMVFLRLVLPLEMVFYQLDQKGY